MPVKTVDTRFRGLEVEELIGSGEAVREGFVEEATLEPKTLGRRESPRTGMDVGTTLESGLSVPSYQLCHRPHPMRPQYWHPGPLYLQGPSFGVSLTLVLAQRCR